MVLIDLTMPLTPETPVYPGDAEPKFETAGVMARDGWNDHVLHMGNHTGTHIDAPSHMVERGKSLNQFPVDRFFGRGVLVDGTERVTVSSLEKYEIEPKDIVLVYTAASENYNAPDYYEKVPPIEVDAAEWLGDRHVSMVGFDAGTSDYGSKHDPPFGIHRALLSRDVLIIENLIGLRELIGKIFRVFAFPLAMEIDGAPMRVIAEVE